MQIRQLFTDDDAVSPVIGVILMVAITVILAAVIASFVLGLGDQPQQTPQTQFEFDYTDSTGNGTGLLAVSHNGGESLEPDEVELRGDGFTSGPFSASGASLEGEEVNVDSANTAWSEMDSPPTQITTGNSIYASVTSDYDITVTYVPSEGGNTAPLADDQGPDA